jgi:hypothetical protein
MDDENRLRPAQLAMLACYTFLSAILATKCVLAKDGPSAAVAVPSDDAAALIVYARTHPDPAVRGAFADRMERGDVTVRIDRDETHAIATYGSVDGHPVLTFDRASFERYVRNGQQEEIWAVLTHEYAHHLQHREGLLDGLQDERVTQTGCATWVAIELDAYAKTCRDARRFGWTGDVASDACRMDIEAVVLSQKRRLQDGYPDCVPVWNSLLQRQPLEAPAPPVAKKRPVRKRSGATYLSPP